MKPIEFFVITAKMREAQNKYFALPQGHPDKPKMLKESKRLEGIIDREIKHVVVLKDPAELAAAWAPFDPCYATQQKFPI